MSTRKATFVSPRALHARIDRCPPQLSILLYCRKNDLFGCTFHGAEASFSFSSDTDTDADADGKMNDSGSSATRRGGEVKHQESIHGFDGLVDGDGGWFKALLLTTHGQCKCSQTLFLLSKLQFCLLSYHYLYFRRQHY